MKIKVKLMGMLKDKSPEGDELELVDDGTISHVLAQLDIDSQSVQVFSVNGSIVRDQATQLNDGDELVVLPPVGGG